MADEQGTDRDADGLAVYQIRLKGHLGQQRRAWFEGLTIDLEEDGNSLLSGPVVDQAALHGVLRRIRDLGMPLLSVNRIDSDQIIEVDVDRIKGDHDE